MHYTYSPPLHPSRPGTGRRNRRQTRPPAAACLHALHALHTHIAYTPGVLTAAGFDHFWERQRWEGKEVTVVMIRQAVTLATIRQKAKQGFVNATQIQNEFSKDLKKEFVIT